jgi:outer membrane murein-binding lipoprotein Lpp
MKKKNMKKLCVLTTALVAALLATLVLAGCGNPAGDDDGDSNSDVFDTYPVLGFTA